MSGFRVSRTSIAEHSFDTIEELGGQYAWNWAVPLPYRALSLPSLAIMPARPTTLEDRLGYYACLQSFLLYSFGWTRPDKGLLWWLDNGSPTGDRRFELIQSVWGDDETLLGFLAWLASGNPRDHGAPLERWVVDTDTQPLVIASPWADRLRDALTTEHWSGGRDPHHLGRGDHVGAPSSDLDPNRQRLLAFDRSSRTATYTSDTIRGWYSGLAATVDALPDLDVHTWHVDVYVKPIGHLGVYRRSRATGLWFSGKHSIHTVGN